MAPAWRNSYLRYKTYFLNISSHYSKSEDVKMFMELLLSLATIIIFSVLAIKPTLVTIAQLLKEIEAKKQIVAQMDEKIRNISRAQNIYEEEKERIAILGIAIPKEPNPEGFIHQLEAVIGQDALKIISISVNGATLLGTPKTNLQDEKLTPFSKGASGLSFSVSGSSPYPSLVAFISDLEKLRRPVKIDNLFINASETETGRELILVVNARTPYLREDNLSASP